jgi:hypothetical protein
MPDQPLLLVLLVVEETIVRYQEGSHL